ncbi:hypothetical protein [Anaerostipes sp.]|nr:hypothetical protein [Anaerostipes sp.]
MKKILGRAFIFTAVFGIAENIMPTWMAVTMVIIGFLCMDL